VEVTVSTDAEEELEEYSESDRFVLVDPGDYAESNKIRQIFEAEKECRNIILENPSWNILGEVALMMRVQHFAVQLWPIICEAIEAEIITEKDVEITSHNIWHSDIRAFAQQNFDELPDAFFHSVKPSSHSKYHKSMKAQFSIIIFNHLSMIKQKLGLGLKMDRIKAPAEV
jgi:hypothetical protein